GSPGKMNEGGTQFVGADCGSYLAPPQRHVEVGVLAAQELEADEAADAARAEWPEEKGFERGIETHHDQWNHAGIGPHVTLPKLEEVVALVGGGEGVGLFQRAPVRFSIRHLAEYLHPGNTTIRGRQALAVSGLGSYGDDVHGL